MLNYYQLLATGNWQLATALSPSIRSTLYAIPDTSDERQATCDEFALFWSFLLRKTVLLWFLSV